MPFTSDNKTSLHTLISSITEARSWGTVLAEDIIVVDVLIPPGVGVMGDGPNLPLTREQDFKNQAHSTQRGLITWETVLAP